MLIVEEDKAQISEYVKKKLGTFQTGRAFYELDLSSNDEDLKYYKEVVYVQEEVS